MAKTRRTTAAKATATSRRRIKKQITTTSTHFRKPVLPNDTKEVLHSLIYGLNPGLTTLFPPPSSPLPPCLLESECLRKSREMTYTMQTDYAMNGSWLNTEQYIHGKDVEMLRYLQDFPISTWLIEPEDATAAFEKFLEREELRRHGVSVFANGVPRTWWPRGSETRTVAIIPDPVVSAPEKRHALLQDAARESKESASTTDTTSANTKPLRWEFHVFNYDTDGDVMETRASNQSVTSDFSLAHGPPPYKWVLRWV